MIRVGIIGASGYGGGEVLRWLTWHPKARITFASSNTYAGQPVAAAFPGLAKRVDIMFQRDSDASAVTDCDVVFLARDNGAAMDLARVSLSAGCKTIDLSADFRFRDPSTYEEWYGIAHQW